MGDISKIRSTISNMIDAGYSEDDINKYLADQGLSEKDLSSGKIPDNKKSMSVTDVASGAISNLGPSAKQFAQDMVQPILHPVDTFNALKSIATDENARAAVVDALKERYGGVENIKRTIATDPVGALGDVASIFTGGGALVKGLGYAGKVSKLEQLGNTAKKVGNAIDPINLATQAARPVVKGVSNAYQSVKNYTRPLPDELQGMNKAAAKRLADVVETSGMSRQDMAAEANRLGDRGFLADNNQLLTDVTEVINQQQGGARNITQKAYKDRAAGAADTIRQSIDVNMGRPVNVPRLVDQMQGVANEMAAPLYQEFRQMTVPSTNRIEGIINRIQQAEPGILREAVNNAILDGIDPRYTTNLRPDYMSPMTGQGTRQRTKQWTGAELDAIKQKLDDIAFNALNRSEPDLTTYNRYNNLARSLASAVDMAISPRNPNQSIYAQARSYARSNLSGRQAMNEGRRSFNRDNSADQIEYDLENMDTGLERGAFLLGAREQLRSKMDNAATNYGPSGDRSARNTLNSPESRRKLATIVGQREADDISKTIDAENTMAKNYDQVMLNSATARRLGGSKFVPQQYDSSIAKDLTQATATGLLARAAFKIANGVTLGKLNRRNQLVAEDMAKALISQGATQDQIVNGIYSMLDRRNLSKKQTEYLDNIVKRIGYVAKKAKAPLYQSGRAERVLSGSQQGLMLDENDQPITR